MKKKQRSFEAFISSQDEEENYKIIYGENTEDSDKVFIYIEILFYFELPLYLILIIDLVSTMMTSFPFQNFFQQNFAIFIVNCKASYESKITRLTVTL